MAVCAAIKLFPLKGSSCLRAAAMLVPSVIVFCSVLESANAYLPGLSHSPEPPGTVHTIVSVEPVKDEVAEYGPFQCTSLVQEQAEQELIESVAQNIELELWPEVSFAESYDDLAAFGGDNIIQSFFCNCGELALHRLRQWGLIPSSSIEACPQRSKLAKNP